MCGIIGVASPSVDIDAVKAGLANIRYRGPDHTQVMQDGNTILGHNRLSIIDLDARSHQPFQSADKRFVIVFNGEIYNFRALRKELGGHGHKFRTESDTEVIVAGYAEWGTNCFKKFHGMFALALYDNLNREIILARDRFGEKPLFYSVTSDGFAFCSELNPFRRILKNLKIDTSSLIDFLHLGFIPAPKTVYENINKLLPGYYLKFSCEGNKITEMSPYFDLSFSEAFSKTSRTELKEAFRHTGEKVASEISVSDVSLGAFLSGGLDSAGSVYFLKRANQELETFTAGFSHEEFDESTYASITARHLNVRNINKVIDQEDFVSEYRTMVEHYGEPHNDFSFIPTHLICREAAKHHTVMISGDGADELFCGYPRYHKLRWYATTSGLTPLYRLGASLSNLLPMHSNVRNQLHLFGLDEVDFYLTIMSKAFQPREIDLIAGPVLKEKLTQYSTRAVIRDQLKNCSDYGILQKLRYLDIKLTLADDMLVKVDRASMANSIEVRPFYLHPLIADFAFNLSINDLVTFREDKYFLKMFFADKLPMQNVFRKKMGFVFPLKELVTGPLRPFFEDCIRHLPEELINKKYISTIVANHTKGRRNYTAQLNSLMNLGLWISSYG
jgi:asparagine synthase (glutamine-hydrolysing)